MCVACYARWRYDNDEATRKRQIAHGKDRNRRLRGDPDHLERKRDGYRRTAYGLRAEDYAALLAFQGGVCALCRTPRNEGPSLHIDHDHACCDGVVACGYCVRGALCGPCNNELAPIDRLLHAPVSVSTASFDFDSPTPAPCGSPEWGVRAIAYLLDPPALRALGPGWTPYATRRKNRRR